MGFLRRRESLHERLAREGGLGDEPPVLDPRPPTMETGIHGIQRPRAWDTTVAAEVDGIDGDEATFVALPDGSLLVEDGPGESLQPLAETVERELKPPYRARAVRRGESLWAVQAQRIEVLELAGAPNGETLDLTHTEADGTELRVDGERVFGTVPELEARGSHAGPEYAIHAARLDDDLWEIRVSAL